MDVHTKKQRSYNMSRIRSKNTKPELILFSKLKEAGIKFRRHHAILGKPDVVFAKEKVAIFIDGEYWHGKNFVRWKDNLSVFWLNKIGLNIKRDKAVRRQLRQKGWRIFRIWGRDMVKESDKYLQKIKFLISESKKTS